MDGSVYIRGPKSLEVKWHGKQLILSNLVHLLKISNAYFFSFLHFHSNDGPTERSAVAVWITL
jgi:hypothetical protein